MAANKSFTSAEQSRKLAEILPTESADYHFSANLSKKGYLEKPIWGNPESANYSALPCWSLSALLKILPYPILCKKSDNTWGVDLWVDNKLYCTYASDKIDACYEMIIKLHKLNLL